ncbi:hypothetical protein BgiBS90_004897, partial [Biomphalaria glabrata]
FISIPHKFVYADYSKVIDASSSNELLQLCRNYAFGYGDLFPESVPIFHCPSDI